MSAQPADAGPAQAILPRTIRAIRAALPEAERPEFAADLEDTEAGGLAVVVTKWWTRAVVWSNPGTVAELEQVRAGTARTVPIEQVLGADWRG